ncbi:hypothetical protein NliqN6_3097 [Naganishia liquefaciens]|uniref:CBM21 domain-containing protein n=1 Tax=Naganishia liquefaciens TaxID=104408 RepID=A0A8H3YEL4_9TREE|nr:hypothetical protein NliqN6_3097 [Naganishia liquefaciens]
MPYAEPTSPISSTSSSRMTSPVPRVISLPSLAAASEAIDGLPTSGSSAAAETTRSKTPTPPRSRAHSQAYTSHVDYKFQDEASQTAPVLPRRSSHISPPESARHSRHASPALSPIPYERSTYANASPGITGLPRRSSSYGRHALLVSGNSAQRPTKDPNAAPVDSSSSSSGATLVSSSTVPSGAMDKVSDSLEKYAARIREQEEREKAEQDLRRKMKQQKVARQLEARARMLEQTGEFFPSVDASSALTGTSSSEGELEDESRAMDTTLDQPAKELGKSSTTNSPLGDSLNATHSGSTMAAPTVTSPTGPLPLTCPDASPPTRRAPVINPRHRPRDGPSLGLRRQPSSSLQLNIPPTPPNVPSMGTPNSMASPAVSNVSSSAYPYNMDRPTSSFIRKKSGEVLKPSLKRRSLSTPHLPIRQETGYTKSEPPTPGVNTDDFEYQRHKNVRFAGSDNDQEKLENVVLFLSQQKVTAVSKAADGEDGAYPVTETETEADTDANEYTAFRARRAQEAREIDSAEKIVFGDGTSTVPRLAIDFSPAGRQGLKDVNVVLERAELPSNLNDPLVLRGSVLVRNVMFQKWVVVRFTLDNWQTVSEVSATHVVHLPSQTTGDEGWDRFTFAVKLEDLRRRIDEKQLLLCIRFSVEGKEWWDSNDGSNYRFAFKKTQPPKRRTKMFDLSAPESPTSPRSPVPAAPLPGTRGSNFGRMTGWNFPGMGNPNASPSKGVLGQPNASSPPIRRTVLPRRTSDASKNASSFTAPPIPDVHEHLKLKTYIAPAPPLSPPRESASTSIDHKEAIHKPSHSVVIGGQYASLPVPKEDISKNHERRRSWGGENVEGKPAFREQNSWTPQPGEKSIALLPPAQPPQAQPPIVPPIEGTFGLDEKTDTAQNFRKDASIADVNCAVSELSIMTPPSSALSSPPPDEDSGSTSASTATMSPASHVSPELEDAELPDVVVDPTERDQRLEDAAAATEGMNSDSYQDFIKKYCFFSSYSSETVSPAHSRSQTPLGFVSHDTSPNPYGADYPTFQHRDQLTPTGSNPTGYSSSSDHYFGFQPGSSSLYSSGRSYNPLGWGLSPSGSGSGRSSNNSGSGGTNTPYIPSHV